MRSAAPRIGISDGLHRSARTVRAVLDKLAL
jgi:hypothetical protein